MSAEHRTCGIGAFLPMSCRGRAEAFARRLQTRLHHLGGTSESDQGESEESWLTSQVHYPTLHQPRHSTSSESDVYYDFDLESPGSPQEEATEADLKTILLNGVENQDVESGCVTATSPGSDSSDGNYYDPESFDLPQDCHNGQQESHTESMCTSGKQMKSNETLLNIVDETKHTRTKIDGVVTKFTSKQCSESIEQAEEDIEEEEEEEEEVEEDGTEESRECEAAQEEEKHESETESIDPSTDEVTEDEIESDNERINRERQTHYASSIEYTKSESTDTNEESKLGEEVDVEEAGTQHETQQETYCSIFTLMSERTIECAPPPTPPPTPDEEALKNHVECHVTMEACSVIEEVCPTPVVTRECSTKVVVVKCASLHPVDDDDDEEEMRPQRVQRCSSLKTGKTPPGTPGRKKIVRFADVLGLDLADVRTFLDEIPKVPTSAYEDLHNADLSLGNSAPAALPRADRALMPLFQQPGGVPDFLDKVRRQYVCLENAMVKDMVTCAITGTVRVINLDFNKSVHIRYSLDNWRTFCDLQATYVENSCDGFSDKFTFMMYAHTLAVGQRLEFAVRFQCHGVQYWDSNGGINYIFQCLPPASPQPFLSLASPDGDRWASFY